MAVDKQYSTEDQKKSQEHFKDDLVQKETEQKVFSPESLPEEKDTRSLGEEELIRTRIRQELDNMELSDVMREQVHMQANNLASLKDDQKLKNLLGIAKEKGVVFAVGVAKKMDPFLMDVFHDLLVKEGYYKNFKK